MKSFLINTFIFIIALFICFSGHVQAEDERAWETSLTSGSGGAWEGMWGSSGNDIFANRVSTVGDNSNKSTVFHFDGNEWVVMDLGGTYRINGISGRSSSDVYASSHTYGSSDTDTLVLHYNGSTWTELTPPSEEYNITYHGIWVNPSGGVYVISYRDAYHLEGTTLVKMGKKELDGTTNWSLSAEGIWGTSDTNIFTVGSEKICHFNGVEWDIMYEGDFFLYSIWGTGDDNIYAVGYLKDQNKGVIYHYDGSSWQSVLTGYGIAEAIREELYDVWGSSGTDVFAVGEYRNESNILRGVVFHFNGETWVNIAPYETWGYYSIWGTGYDNIYVGRSGGISRYGMVESTTTTTGPGTVPDLKLTYPAGESPKVFITGWVFGAKCTYNENGTVVDISDQVSWGGSGTFKPNKGSRSYPTFNSEGQNTIELSVTIDGEEYKKEYQVEVVNTRDYARVADQSKCPVDAHGCPACPHINNIVLIQSGSPNISIDGRPAARVGDGGRGGICCGPYGGMVWLEIGDENVLIDGRPAAKKGDQTRHCGGSGRIIEGSPGYYPDADSVLDPLKTENHSCSITTGNGVQVKQHTCDTPHTINVQSDEDGTISGKVTDTLGSGIEGVGVAAYGEATIDVWGALTDENGEYQITGLPDDNFRIHFWGGNWAYNDGYLSSWYNNKTSMDSADSITITSAGSVTGIDVTLAAGGSISGTVKDASGGGIEKATVGAYGESGGTSFGYTDENGEYTIAGLEDDSYRVYCDAGSQGYINGWYNDKSSQDSADLVIVTVPSQASDIDFTLSGSGGISGTVKDTSGNGIEEVYVKVFGESTSMTGMGATDENGAYEILGLIDDSYRVQFQGESQGYITQWYNSKSSWDLAEHVTVTAPNKTTGINAELPLESEVTTTTTTDGGGCPTGKIYGEYSEETKLLRYFRDNVLSKTREGQEIIRLYYEWSPAIVRVMEEDEKYKEDVKEMLDGVLPLIRTEAE